MENKTKTAERFFSVELKSKTDIENLTLANGVLDVVLIEGCLGNLLQASFEEGEILEVVGTKGTLRINLKESELKKLQSAEKFALKAVDA